jgi:YD repeat-containing protein
MPQPQISYSTTSNRMDGFCYDAAGNVLDDGPCPAGTNHKYAYDGQGKLISSNFGATTYVYDAEGHRVAKVNSGTVTNVYLYDVAGHRVVDTDGALNVQRKEIFAGNRHLATYNGSVIYHHHANWLGTEAARTDASGALCETLSSLPFGDNLQTAGSCSPTQTSLPAKNETQNPAGCPTLILALSGSTTNRGAPSLTQFHRG